MLTRAQIQRLAQRQRVGMQMQERDYLQHLLLLPQYVEADVVLRGIGALKQIADA